MQNTGFGKDFRICLDEGHKHVLEGQILDILGSDKFGTFIDFINFFQSVQIWS